MGLTVVRDHRLQTANFDLLKRAIPSNIVFEELHPAPIGRHGSFGVTRLQRNPILIPRLTKRPDIRQLLGSTHHPLCGG